MPVSTMLNPTHPTLLAETCSSSSKNPTNFVLSKVETGKITVLTTAVQRKYKAGFGHKKLSLLVLLKLSELRTTQKKSESYWTLDVLPPLSLKLRTQTAHPTNQIYEPESDEVSKDVPVEASIAAPTIIALQIDPKTTVADSLVNTSNGTITTPRLCRGSG
ncbi:unnamed protein product [Caenorhabditis brenneri]